MKRFFVSWVIVAALAGVVPARAATVTVNFGISAGKPTPTGAACPVSVPSGASGIAVLSAALAKHCIVEYHVTPTAFGNFVDSIDHVTGPLPGDPMFLTYWAMSVDGTYTDYGVDDFVARNGAELVFTYTTWATCLTPVGC